MIHKDILFASVRDYVVQILTGEGFGNGTDTMVYMNLVGTLGDSGKRFLVHNMEGTEEKFQTGQVQQNHVDLCIDYDYSV